MLNAHLGSGTVVDLIDHSKGVWKCDLIKKLYPHPLFDEILRILISKTGMISDKLLWKHSSSGEYSVKNAYNLLLKDHLQDSHSQLRPCQNPPEVWNLIWKVNVPYKVSLFVWKLMHDRLPTLLSLKNKGIPTDSTCPMCKEKEEYTSHLFLHCPFARACWGGSSLAVHSSDLSDSSMHTWISNFLSCCKDLDQDMMNYVQTIFTYLWTI